MAPIDGEMEWAVVVGAGGTIGRGIVTRFAERGFGIVAVGRTLESLEDLAAGNATVVACVADISDPDAPEQIRAVLAGVVRVAVNSAAAPLGGTILDVTPDAIRAAVDIKVSGTLHLVHGVQDHLVADSRIVAIGGNLGYDPIPEAATAGVGNAALANAIRQLSRALGPRGVTCHVVAPGPVWTERLQSLLRDAAASRGIAEEEVVEEFRARSPIGHLVTVEEVVWAVDMLSHPEARALAGGTLLLDAGQRTAIP